MQLFIKTCQVHPIANDDAIEKASSDVDHQLPVASALSQKVLSYILQNYIITLSP